MLLANLDGPIYYLRELLKVCYESGTRLYLASAHSQLLTNAKTAWHWQNARAYLARVSVTAEKVFFTIDNFKLGYTVQSSLDGREYK